MSRVVADVSLDCVYRVDWPDGYGARGWKLRAALGDPEIIAATAETGERIPTSVFVHDVLDHALCGLKPSGPYDEAIALGQLASRTGADPTPDFEQIVDEDLLSGTSIDAAWLEWLPSDLQGCVADGLRDPKAMVAALQQHIGRADLRRRLIEQLGTLSLAGAAAARAHFERFGLSYEKRSQIGMALQGLLQQADEFVLDRECVEADAKVRFSPTACRFELIAPTRRRWSAAY
jgi:hypothetical protein